MAQGRTLRIALPPSAAREGHGIQRDSRALVDRSRAVLSSIVTARPGWFDRPALAPLARWTLPGLVARAIPSVALARVAAVLAPAGIVGLVFELPVTGCELVEGGSVADARALQGRAQCRDTVRQDELFTIAGGPVPHTTTRIDNT